VRRTLMTITLLLAAACPAAAKTFTRSAIAPELGLDALTRRVARERVGRDLFANPYATVTVAGTDLYDRFPYVESRRFQIVSDPRWNRLVCGEPGQGLSSYDGRGGPLGTLSEPHGMAVGENSFVYVADTGNDRIVVLEAVTRFGDIVLEPRFAIPNLAHPYGVAWSDGGTPFVTGDDVLYVAETGRNRVVALALAASGARAVATIGDLGSGTGRFAGPMAIAVGRDQGRNTKDVYVADAHNQRIVHLRHDGSALAWVTAACSDADVVTALDTDAWGNVYAAAPRAGLVRKFSPALVPVAELRSAMDQPKAFHVPFSEVRDHRDGSVARVGQPNGVAVERWSDDSGLRLWSLGVEIAGLALEGGARPAARFTLTDRAAVTLEAWDGAGRLLERRPLGTLVAGPHEVPLAARAGDPNLVVRLSASSSYAEGGSDVAEASLGEGGVAALPAQPVLLGCAPNPGSSTRIRFLLPAGASAGARLGIFDTAGRRVRSFERGFAPGMNEVAWDGADAQGKHAAAGVYFYRLEVSGRRLTQSLVLSR
jgi:DNA-binding beta-propeller fold protein YncE